MLNIDSRIIENINELLDDIETLSDTASEIKSRIEEVYYDYDCIMDGYVMKDNDGTITDMEEDEKWTLDEAMDNTQSAIDNIDYAIDKIEEALDYLRDAIIK